MPSRLSKIFSRSEKEKEAEAEAERNHSSSSNTPPPSYAPPDYDGENTLDPPDITAGFSNLSLTKSAQDGFPTVDETIAHLKVLECFYRLRQKIGSTDGLFGIDNRVVLDASPEQSKTPELLAKLAEKRWAIYLNRAVDRLDRWLTTLLPNAKMLCMSDLQAKGERGLLCEPSDAGPTLQFSQHDMPPVDVLMVWHAYMLNPRAYLEDCLRYGRMRLWHTPMPWQAAAQCVNSDNFMYEAGQDAESMFQTATGLSWNNLEGSKEKIVKCPGCGSDNLAPWTLSQAYAPGASTNQSMLSQAIDNMLSSGTGYCDKDFTLSCSACGDTINHERLKAAKFCTDIQRALSDDVPMGGTVFGGKGLPGRVGSEMDVLAKYSIQLPNNLIRAGLGGKILAAAKLNGRGINESMEAIRDAIEVITQDHAYMRKARNSPSHRLQRDEKIGIRRMMSRYWENSSPFALDLVGAVVRQGSFIEKMHNIDWLHSPALPSTMRRLLVKYSRFVEIMSDRQNMAVPTLDVDLAWHTHQLNPYGYMMYTVKATKQFVDHDDKVAETKLNDAFAWTSKTYQRKYNEPYSECTCWYCEAVRESHTSAASRLFNGSNSKAQDSLLHKVDQKQDPSKSVHISAHNAVRPTDDTKDYQLKAGLKADELEKAYQKACQRAQKKGRSPPKRNDYYYSDAWGYPVYIPAYSPYIGYVGYAPMYYPVTPGCMAVGAGSAGNCCSGTCGGAVAAGGCGGVGGGCAGGGMAGGCGGGAGGGCGGGGGGCGGGGGGCGGGGGA